MVDKDNFEDFGWQEEVEIESKPQVKLFKKKDYFIWFINKISDNPLQVAEIRPDWKENWGNKVFTFIAIKGEDHKSEDKTATGDPIENIITPWEQYNFFTNYNKKDFLNINWNKLSALPIGAIVKLENMGKKKSETSSFSYKVISIIWKKDDKWNYLIHPDYKAIDDFTGEEELTLADVPF